MIISIIRAVAIHPFKVFMIFVHFPQIINNSHFLLQSRDVIQQQYLYKVTLDLSKGKFFTEVFLGLGIHKTKVRNVQFYNFLLEI